MADSLAPVGPQSFEEMIEALRRVSPGMDDRVEALLQEHPELGLPGGGFMLGRIVAINIIDFLCYAYGMPDKGYTFHSAFID